MYMYSEKYCSLSSNVCGSLHLLQSVDVVQLKIQN